MAEDFQLPKACGIMASPFEEWVKLKWMMGRRKWKHQKFLAMIFVKAITIMRESYTLEKTFL